MLRKSYDTCILGQNYISLIYGLISVIKNNNTLIIEESEKSFASKWCQNIGYLERSVLLNLGEKYDIEVLKNIDTYLLEQNTIVNLNDTLVEFCDSPYANIKEIARKMPDCFSDIYHQHFMNINSDVFDQDFFKYLDQLSVHSFDYFEKEDIDSAFNSESSLQMNELFEHFFNYLEMNTLVTKQFHYILQVMFQSVFSSGISAVESKYLLISILSPRYKVDYTYMRDDLLEEYRALGGDTKSAKVADWGIRDNYLEYILLGSIDGVIKTNKTYYFDQTAVELPFRNKTEGIPFKSIEVRYTVQHEFVSSFMNKRIIFTTEARMGSDFPYWEIFIDEDGKMVASYSYADYLGTKASFYYQHALEDIFTSLEAVLPGFEREPFFNTAKVTTGFDIWYEYPPEQKAMLHPHHNFALKDLYQISGNTKIQGISHCGPNRTKSLGFLSYMLDVFSSDINFSKTHVK